MRCWWFGFAAGHARCATAVDTDEQWSAAVTTNDFSTFGTLPSSGSATTAIYDDASWE